eukprot:2327049-Ditylum_brightwellii.AAC.1
MDFEEHNLDTTQQEICGTKSKKISNTIPLNCSQLASSPTPVLHTYKPEWTMLVEAGDVLGRKISQGSNKYGRWSYFRLCGEDHKVITVVMAY